MRFRNFFAVTISALLLITGATSTGAAPEAKEVYIIKFADSVNLGSEIAALKASGANVEFEYSEIFKGAAAAMSASQANAMSRNPRVAYVVKDATARTQVDEISGSWGQDRVDTLTLNLDGKYSYTSTGAGATVYVVDTGIDTAHPQFEGRARFGGNFIGGVKKDCNGHGTHVAGTIGSKDFGIAKKANLVAVKVLDCNGSGTGRAILAGIDWIAKDKANRKITTAVVNMSLGFNGIYQPADDAVAKLSLTNVVAVAAGNSNLNACDVSPARATGVLTVGASDKADSRASFSNYGACVEIFAPGVDIVSTFPNNRTATMSGTSMASPHVAGIAARVLGGSTNSATSVSSAILNTATTAVVDSTLSGSSDRLLYRSPSN